MSLRIKGSYYFGTGAGLPSLIRNVSAMAIDFEKEWFLFDCGEGTQQRIMASPFKMTRLTHIFISHFHGDHIYGLPGLLATMQLQGVTTPLTLVGPKGLKGYVDFIFNLSESRYKRQMNFIELDVSKKGVFEAYSHKGFTVTAARMKHKIPCLGYRLNMNNLDGKLDPDKANELGIPSDARRRDLVSGKTVTLDNGDVITSEMVVSKPRYNPDFTYITDTSMCKNAEDLAAQTDIFHHECTFMEDEEELALKSGHSTLTQVLNLANICKVKQLQLAHFSPRYDTYTFQSKLKEEAFRIIFTKDQLYVPFND